MTVNQLAHLKGPAARHAFSFFDDMPLATDTSNRDDLLIEYQTFRGHAFDSIHQMARPSLA